MTGLWVVLGVTVLVAAFGFFRARTDGRAKAAAGGQRLDASRLGAPLGSRVTLVQFSSPTCAPCRQVRATLGSLADSEPGVVHVEIDAPTQLELASEFGVMRTPTTLVLDPDGFVRSRIVGALDRRAGIEAIGLAA